LFQILLNFGVASIEEATLHIRFGQLIVQYPLVLHNSIYTQVITQGSWKTLL